MSENENKIRNRSFNDVFSSNMRYEIPFFQRGYAWEQRQWEKLLQDLEFEIIPNVKDNNFHDEELFFGSIVVLEQTGGHESLKRYLIVDGQQRITTVYLMLGVIKQLLETKVHLSPIAQDHIATINKLLHNDIEDHDDYTRIKVFSTKGDRLPTFRAVFGKDITPNSPYLLQDQMMYNSETNKVDAFTKWITKKIKNYDVSQFWNLSQALIYSLKIVWIPLSQKDDAQAIFESLNDAGRPLSASELLCNYLFKPLVNDKNIDYEEIHNNKWLKSRRIIGENSFEDFLRTLFSMSESKWVGKDRRLYVHFKNKNKNLSTNSAISNLDNIYNYANLYNNVILPIQFPHSNDNIKKLLIKLESTNISSANPFILAVLKALDNQKIIKEEVEGLLFEIYVLFVRRKISSLPITKFDTFFPPLFDKIINEENKVKALHTLLQEEQLWVSNQVFQDAFLNKEIYNSRELNFARMVLQEIDKFMQTFGQFPDYTTINSIEHVLPQTLDDHWKVYLREDASNIKLNYIKNTIGNLCLISPPANSSEGQRPFQEKIKHYTDVSALTRDVKARLEPWNIAAIEKRSNDLALLALKVWKWSI